MSYQNPIPIFPTPLFKNGSLLSNPDPYALKFKGRYFCYSSGFEGVNVLESDNLQSFFHCGVAYTSEWEESFWAPTVLYWNGTFYLYYSSMKKGETDDHQHYLRVASADNPLGPFIYEQTLISQFAIDPHVVCSDGRLYIFYSINDTDGKQTGRIGTIIVLDSMSSPVELKGNPRPVLLPTIDEEIFVRNRYGDGRDWHTLEGAFYFERNGTRYLMYSGNAYTHEDYFVGYATATMDETLESVTFSKGFDETVYSPLIRKTQEVEGTGHNSVVKAPDNISDVVVYHGRLCAEKAEDGQDNRKIFIDLIHSQKGKLATLAPTILPQNDLPQPYFRDLFSEGLSYWNINEAICEIKNYELVIEGTGTLMPKISFLSQYYLEVWMHFTGSGFFGIDLVAKSGCSYLTIGINEKLDCICLCEISEDRHNVNKLPITRQFSPGCYHKMAVDFKNNKYTVYLDDEKQCDFQGKAEPVKPGLFIENGKVKIASFELTSL